MKKLILSMMIAVSSLSAVEASALPRLGLGQGPLAALRNGNGPLARIRARIQARRDARAAQRAAAQQSAAQSSSSSSSN